MFTQEKQNCFKLHYIGLFRFDKNVYNIVIFNKVWTVFCLNKQMEEFSFWEEYRQHIKFYLSTTTNWIGGNRKHLYYRRMLIKNS